MSWDVWHHGRGAPIEIYGTEGTLVVPDPNMFAAQLLFATGTDTRLRLIHHSLY